MKELISVVMPVYNSSRHIQEAVRSIQTQTYKEWELLVINEYDSNDGSAQIVQAMAAGDSRIKLIQNESRLGLAESLNRGMGLAAGAYIARMDADDLSHVQRLEKQAAYLHRHPDISLCGSWQRYFGPDVSWVHKPAAEPEMCRAGLLFDCDLCHSTVMLRRKDFADEGLWYDGRFLAEDFELWSRAVHTLRFANLPEVLGAYRVDGENITARKKSRMAEEHAYITAAALKRSLGIAVQKKNYCLLEGWGNPFYREKNRKKRRQMYHALEALLRRIYERNQEMGVYEEHALLWALQAKWRYAKYLEPKRTDTDVRTVDEIFHSRCRPDYRYLWHVYRQRHTSVRADIRRIGKYVRARL